MDTMRPAAWPRLRLEDWPETRDTLPMRTQIVGKVQMAHLPLLNHWWQVTLRLSPRGLITPAIPYGAAPRSPPRELESGCSSGFGGVIRGRPIEFSDARMCSSAVV